jgi:hypothetical protein
MSVESKTVARNKPYESAMGEDKEHAEIECLAKGFESLGHLS